MAHVIGLGHVGIYVRDLERMVAFYRDVMGMQITKQNQRAGVVFFSADPAAVDHEIALMRGRPVDEEPHLINQISLRVATLDDLRTFYRRLTAEGYRIDTVSNHGSAIGCYFFDPEGNRTEVFWVTGRACWVPNSDPIDLEQPDEAIIAEVDRVWRRIGHVPVGGRMEQEAATLQTAAAR
jgi:catechol-2,3-dioxygenase